MLIHLTPSQNINHQRIYKKPNPDANTKPKIRQNLNKNNYIENNCNKTEPLNKSAKAQLSFKGSNFLTAINKGIKEIGENIFYGEKTISKKNLEQLSEIINKHTNGVIQTYIKEAVPEIEQLKNSSFIKNGMEVIVEPGFSKRLLGTITGPFGYIARLIKVKSNPKLAEQLKTINKLKNCLNLKNILIEKKLIEETAENGLKITAGSSEKLKSHLDRWQGDGANYGVTGAAITNRFVAGIVSSLYLGIDFYNSTRIINDDDKQAKKEAFKRLGQEAFRLAVTLFTMFGVNNFLEKANNKSIPFAILSNGLIVAISEIIGRKLIGNEVLPMSKERFEHLKQTGKLQPKKETEEKNRLDYTTVFAKNISRNTLHMQGSISNINKIKMINGGKTNADSK